MNGSNGGNTMDIKVTYTIEGFTFEATLSTKEDKNEFLKQMKYMKADLLEKGLISGEPVKAVANKPKAVRVDDTPAVQPQAQPDSESEDMPISQKQYDYLITLGAAPAEICNLTKSAATKMIHDIKRNIGWE